MFVDNWVSGAETSEQAYERFCEAINVLADAHLPLSKWYTNDPNLQNVFSESDCSVEKVISILGLNWSNFSDKFLFNNLDMGNKLIYEPTKRTVLSSIANIYDPLGFLSPFVMYAKILFQDIWCLKLDWNNSLPMDIKNKYDLWLTSSEHLKSFSVNRCYFPSYAWSELRSIELHMFSDSSERGYGCCIYVRALLPNDEFSVNLVCSRSRVCPIKKITLPRLELMAALIGSR